MKRYGDCIRDDGMCAQCSLVSYGLDCHNNKINNLLYRRSASGLTQMELADRSGVNVRQIQRYEGETSDTGNMTLRNAVSIAKVLECRAEDLL